MDDLPPIEQATVKGLGRADVIYEPLATEGYEWINCVDNADYEKFLSFDGSPRARYWTRVKVRRVPASKRHAFNRSDFPWLGSHALIMRRTAVDALGEFIRPYGEILPLETDDGTQLSVLNVTRVLDALDEDRSNVLRSPVDSRIMFVISAVFHPAVIEGVDIFRLPLRAGSTYVSTRFVEAVRKAGLEGLEFKPAAGAGTLRELLDP